MSGIEAVLVAVPARDEAVRLPAALAAVQAAAARCAVPVVVVIAADACVDGTERIALEHGAVVVRTAHGRVGAARAAAVSAGLAGIAAHPSRVWIANSDADSVVPPDWLAVHLAFATAGVQLLRGSVRPAGDLAPDLRRRWARRNPAAERHDHVHGANLGVRADAMLLVGGFPASAVREDVALVAAVLAAGLPTASTDRAPVVTSGRLAGRAPDGFAGYLRDLDRSRPAS